ACLQIDMYTTLDRSDLALASGLAFLRETGGDWPEHPSEQQVRWEYERTRAELALLSQQELVGLPLMTDSRAAATLDLLGRLTVPVFFTNAGLYALLACRTVSLILQVGNSDVAAAAYVRLGLVAGRLFRDYRTAFELCDVARQLVDERGLARLRPVVYFMFGNMVMPWTRHYREGRDLIAAAFREARDTGYLYYATLCANGLSANRFAAGDSLALIQQEAEERVAFGRSVQFESLTDVLRANLALARMLRGLNPRFGSLDGADFDEVQIEQRYARKAAMVQFMYWTVKLKACYFAGDLEGARAAEAHLERLFPNNLTTVHPVEYRFFGALVRTASCDGASEGDRALHLAAVRAHQDYLDEWAQSCPENFEGCAALVAAEVARLSGEHLEAMRLYDRAIRAARDSGFTHVQAMAHQLAAGCHAAQGLTSSSELHLMKARESYLKWGADGKVRQLDALHPQLARTAAPVQPSTSIGTALENLDLSTVMEISRAVSGEIVLDKLIATLLRTAIQQAGAERGVLIVPGDPQPRIEAEAVLHGETVQVDLHEAALDDQTLPASIVRYVLRTKEALLLEDAGTHQAFAADPCVRRSHTRSVFCLPLLSKAKISAILYLENNLAPGVFLSGRAEVLKMLASQAAIALENARLYRDVAEREARIRRLVDANIIGTYIWKVDANGAADAPLVVEANDAFLRMVGYDRAELAEHPLTRDALLAPASRAEDARIMALVREHGSASPVEQELRRKDGASLPVLVGLAAFDERRTEGLAFVVDLTERKQAEVQAHENERRYREVEAALAHASRVATMGQLTASIAHEVSQPISGMITNAQTALRRLATEKAAASSVYLPLERIVRDGTRAREVIQRIRAIVRKAPPRRDTVDINDAAREVIELTSAQARKGRVTVSTALAPDLPPVLGDKVQLQQVILNLAVNAVDAMREVPDGPRQLRVSTAHREGEGVTLSVEDTGPGIDAERLARVFEAFYTTKSQGLGMGLSICRSIVQAHGGRLWASPGAERGTVFRFTLPVLRQAGDEKAPAQFGH
ncbi:MAG TPA: ATP-binding protein, partial [Ramlibacter sp.]|nr:ATP-binding protein [Ramlibacter sp.]